MLDGDIAKYPPSRQMLSITGNNSNNTMEFSKYWPGTFSWQDRVSLKVMWKQLASMNLAKTLEWKIESQKRSLQ